MRFYELVLSSPSAGQSPITPTNTQVPTSGPMPMEVSTTSGPSNIVKTWTSHPAGKYDAGAQNISFDMLVMPASAAVGGSTLTIEGISLDDLKHGVDFTGLDFVLSAGFKKGLPLANPKHFGVIAAGNIFQSFANWEGTDMSLTFVIFPGGLNTTLVLHWPANTELSVAIQNMLNIAYPGVPVNINIGSFLQGHDEIHADSLDSMAQFISALILNQGSEVLITLQNGVFNVSDSTYVPNVVGIYFEDLIGQPTWIEPQIMQVKLTMRADISVGSIIFMPTGMQSQPGLVSTLAAAIPGRINYVPTFPGKFSVIGIRHIGNFRSSDGSQWATLVNCVPVAIQENAPT